MLVGGIVRREGHEVHARMACECGIEFAAERRVGGLEQELDIAAREHGGHVAGAGDLRRAACRIGVDLNRNRRGREPRTRQRLRRRFRVAYEMGDMVEENLAGKGELAVRLSSLVLHQQGLSWRTPRNRRGAC